MAPRPKPIEYHEASGAYEKNPQRKPGNAPPKLEGWPVAPEGYSPGELAAWDSLCDRLEQRGTLCASNAEAIAAYVSARMMYERALSDFRAAGFPMTCTTTNGNVIQHPLVGIVNKLREELRKWSIEFGLTPAARAKVTAIPDEETPEEFNL